MKSTNEFRLCKKCQKPLPMGHKHRYCEACRNQKAKMVKQTLKGAGIAAGSMLGLVVTVATSGRINSKK